MEIKERMVEYFKYCPTCKHKDLNGWEDPCNDCLDNPVNVGTDKPVKYEKKE